MTGRDDWRDAKNQSYSSTRSPESPTLFGTLRPYSPSSKNFALPVRRNKNSSPYFYVASRVWGSIPSEVVFSPTSPRAPCPHSYRLKAGLRIGMLYRVPFFVLETAMCPLMFAYAGRCYTHAVHEGNGVLPPDLLAGGQKLRSTRNRASFRLRVGETPPLH